MSKHSLNSFSTVAMIAGAIFVVAFLLLMFVGDYRFLASAFMAFVIALLTGIIIYLGFGDQIGGTSQSSASGSAESKSTSSGADPAEVAKKSAADKEAAQKAADEKAAIAKAEEQTARKAAEDDAAKKAEQAQAALKETDDTAVAQNEATAPATQAKPTEAADLGEDYDGDGVREGTNEGTRPSGLDAPRNGSADDLKQIKGIGPKMEKLCNSLGFWHFDQVAGWTADEVAWVDANLTGFKGRVSRDEWVEQARVLASGGKTEFATRVEDGDVY